MAGGVRGFKPVPVFHSTQLAIPPALVEPPLPELLQGDDTPDHVWAAIAGELCDAGFDVTVADRQSGVRWNGRTDFVGRSVVVHDDLGPQQQLKTLTHEWAHVHLGHRDLGAGRHVAEVEAESVAFLLMGSVGIDAGGYTIPYVAGWAGGGVEVVKATAERVLVATAAMVGRIEARLDIDLTPNPLTPTAAVDEAPSHLRLVADTPAPPAGLPPWARLLGDVRVALTDRDRAELARQPAPERVAVLIAAAGFPADTAVDTFRELGISDAVTRPALTTIVADDVIDRAPEPLYRPSDILLAMARRPAVGVSHPSTGRELITEWTRIERGPLTVEAPLPQPPVAHTGA